MRRLLTVFAALGLLAGCGQTSNTPTPKLIGEACTAHADCNGRLCEHHVCTRWCTVQGDCPEGFDCGLAQPGDTSASCYKASWSSPPQGGYGTSCAAFAGSCGGDNPCAEGFSCLFGAPCDARAYCTKGCAADTDCPPAMFCGQPDPSDPAKKCLQRVACSPCGTDDQCPANHVCATDKNGERFCAKTCTASTDCHKPEKDTSTLQFIAAPFEVCAADAGGKGDVCQPVAGVCHGASTIANQPQGGICSPCRAGEPSDCTGGTVCFPADTGEQFCSTGCHITATAYNSSGATLTGDTCPAGSYCNFGGPSLVPELCSSFPCPIQGVCAADASYAAITCYPLSN